MNNNYPEYILRVLRERNDLEEDDITGNIIFSEMDYGHWEVSKDTSM